MMMVDNNGNSKTTTSTQVTSPSPSKEEALDKTNTSAKAVQGTPAR
jgi:hypothetical protein